MFGKKAAITGFNWQFYECASCGSSHITEFHINSLPICHLEVKIFEGNTAKMLCGCIRFRSKPKAVRNGLEPPSTLEISEWMRFNRSGAPSPSERAEMSTEVPESLVTPKREVVMEPGVDVRILRILSKGECQELANSRVAESSQGFDIS
jgi:hypothetical protein